MRQMMKQILTPAGTVFGHRRRGSPQMAGLRQSKFHLRRSTSHILSRCFGASISSALSAGRTKKTYGAPTVARLVSPRFLERENCAEYRTSAGEDFLLSNRTAWLGTTNRL